uniref:Uncharacterized protein n=2 Tax=Electrophorus electricus TaxID=8005 RepID=A0AAY5EWE4_ELEEL
MQNISGEMVETAMKKKEPAVEKQKNDEHISLEDPLHSPPDPKLGELKASKCAELFTDTTDTDHILTSVEQAEVADDDQLTEPKEFLGHGPSTPFQEYANIQINAAGHRRKMGSLRTFEGKRGVEDEDGDVCQEEKNMPLADIYDLSSTTNEFRKDDKNEVKEEIKAGSTEYSTREDFSLVCSKQYMHSELFSQTNEQNVSTKTPPSTVLENSDSTEDDRNRKENTEVRNTELCAKIQTKKKKRFGSTRRLQGEHQQGRERKERQWQKVEDTEGTEHDREERCSEEITNLEPTHHLFTEPHSVERKVSLDQSLTTEREEGELKDVTGECGKIDTPPVHLLDVVHQSEPVVFDGASQAKAPLESTKHGESVIDDEQDYEFTSSNEQKMAPVIRDIQNDFTDHASPQEASMTVEDCDSESTENGSSKQVDGSPICATIEHIYEIQDSVIMPVNKEITLEVLSDQVTQLPWDDNSDEDHLVQTTSRELETEPPENTCPVIHIQDLKSTMCNETEVLKMQNISGEMVETAMKKKEPAVEKQKNDEHISLEDPLHSPPDPKLGELKASKCAELFTDTTDTDHILTSVEQAEVADDDQLTEPKEFLGHGPSTPFQEYANIQINAAGHRRKMGSLRTFEGKRGVEDEDGDVCQEEKNMPLADIYDLSSTTNEFSKDDKNEVKEEIKAGSTEYSTREDFSLVCSKQYMHSELFSQTNEQNVSTKTPPSTVLENSDSTEDDRNRKENTEVRNTELCAKIQTKKKKRFGSTRRLQGEHQQGRERKERQWQKVEDTEGTEHDREERCSEEITNLEPTHHLFTEPHSVERKVSLDQSLTTEREEGELKDVTGECGKIDTPPVHLLDVVHQSEPVVFDGASQAKAPLESTKHGESVIDDEQDYEFTSSNEQKMAPVIRDIQNDFTDHASPQEASMTVEDCDSESTENGSSKQVDGSPICATIEHIYEIQDSVIMPVNKEITLEVLSDQVTQLPWDDNSDEHHLVQTTSRELETEPPENTCPVIHIQDLKSTMCNETEVLKMQNISGEMVETAMKKKEPAVEKQKNDEHISLEDPLHSPPDPKLGELKASKCAELFTDTTDTDHILTSVEQAEVADDDQLTELKEFLGHVPSTPFQEYANIQINAAGHRRKMGSLRTFEGKRGVEDEDGDVCQEEKNMPLADIYDLSSTTNEFRKDDKNEVKEEIKAGSTEYSTREDFSLVCSKQYMHSELFSQTNEQNVSTKTPPSTVLENSDSTEDDRNRKENTEVRNTELCAKIQTKKKKRFGSTRRLQGEHQQGRERKERQWQKVEDTEGTEHDREERCSEEITNLEPTHHLFTEPHSVERKVSLDQSLTTEREEGELKDVTGECGKIDTPPVHLLDVVHQSEPVVFDGASQAKAPLESTKHGESVIDDEQDYEFTSSNEQKMAPVIRDIQNDFTDHASPQEASMTVEDCDSESTENGSSKQVDGSPICATIEHIYEIQDSVIMPVNKEITLEVLSDQVTQLPWDDNSDEDHLVQTTSRELETEPPENTCPVIHIQDLKSTMCNETEVLKMQNISGEMVETAMKKKEPAVEKQKNDEHISLEDPLHSPPDPKLGELKASKCAELFTDTTDTDHILTSVEQAEVADDDQLTEPKEFLGHGPSTPFQEYANIQINAAGHRRKMGSLRTFEGKRGVEDEDGDVCQEEKNMPLADIYDLSSTTNEFSKDDKNEVKEEIKAGSTEYSTREDFSLVCSKQYMHSELFSQTNEQNVSTKTPPSTVLENSDSTEDDRNRKENTEVRNTELCAKIQTKKKKRFGSTRRLQGEHQQGRERKERQWQKVEDTEGTEHDREERCSEEITNLEPTHHLFTEPHSVERKVSLDQSLTTEREEGELKDVTGECGKIDTPPVHLLDVVHQSEPVVFDGVSQAKAPLESTKHGESVIDDEQDYEFTSSNEQKMAPVIRDIQNDFTDHASPQEASMTVEDCDSESTENGSSKQVDGSPSCTTIEHNDQVRQLHWDDNLVEDHLEHTTSRELGTEPLDSIYPEIHIKFSISTQDKVISEKSNSEKRRKMGSTRRSLRGQLPESDQTCTIQGIKEEENIKQQKIDQCTPVTGKDNLQVITSVFIPTSSSESSSQSRDHHSNPSNQVIEKIDKKKRKMGSTRKNLPGVENKKPIMERMKDINPKDDEDIAREEAKSAINYGIVNTVSGLHDAACGCSEVDATEQDNHPQLCEKPNQLEGSLLSEIEYELKKGSSLNSLLETYDNQQNIFGNSDPVAEQSQSTLQIPASLKILSQAYTEPASPGRKRKMGSTRKTSRNKHIEETGDKKRETEQDIVTPKISEDTKESAKDVLVPTDDLTVCKPCLISEPGSLPNSHAVSDPSRMETSPSNEQGIKPFVKEVDVSTEDGLVSLDDIRKFALYDGSSGKRVKIDFEEWNKQVPDFGVAVYNVVIVGNCNVGKTSFIKRFQSGHFSPEFYSTVGVDTFVQTITLGNRTIKMSVWDTAGQERYHSITTQLFHKAQGLLLMYDITCSQSFIAVRDWISQIQERAPADVIIMLLGNKKDCADRKVQLREGEDLSREYKINFMECSAATGENVSESMKALAWLLVKQRVRKEEEQTILQQKQPQKKSGCC